MHLDVTERTKAEAALTDLTEAQVWISVNMCVDCMPSVNLEFQCKKSIRQHELVTDITPHTSSTLAAVNDVLHLPAPHHRVHQCEWPEHGSGEHG